MTEQPVERYNSCDPGVEYNPDKSDAKLRVLLDNMESGVAIYKAVDQGDDFLFMEYNRAGSSMDNVRREDAIGRRLREIFPRVKNFGIIDVLKRVWQTGQPEHHTLSLYRDSLLRVWRDNFIFRLHSGEVVVIYSDRTKEKKAEEYVRFARIVYENSHEAIMITDLKGNILDVNPAFSTITGYEKDEVINQNANLMKSDRDGVDFYKRFWEQIHSTGKWQGEIWDRKKSGEIFPKWLSVSTVYDDVGKPLNYIGIFTDLSVIKKAEEDINRLYNYDILTNLPNRSLFYDRLRQSIDKSHVDGKKIAVILMDLDKTARVNESYGISYGDMLLAEVAERLKKDLCRAESLSRFVSDRFIFYLSRLDSYDPIAATIQKIKDIFEKGFRIDDTSIFITASIGVTIFPNDGQKPNELIKNAEIALNHAKLAGANNFQFFSGDMTTRAFERMQLEIAVRSALEKGELHVYYQPKVDLVNEKVVGMEALLRWNHPEMGMVSPVRFIPIAEASDVILHIGEWVLRQACIFAKKIVDQGYSDFVVGVNLSAKQLKQHDFVGKVREILQDTGLPARSLDLELTESMLFDNIEKNITFMDDLKQLGISLSIDDFGTGYSSLSYLKSFPVNTLKIDRSFVMDIPEDKDDMAITATIISMAHSLDLEVVAEGVETKVQANFLRQKGCTLVQGYLFSPPVPEEKLWEILQKGFGG